MDIFDEILQCHRAALTLTEKYFRLYDLLDRTCKQLTESYGTDFSNLFSRLYALCKQTGLRRNAIEHFRQHARRIIRHEEEPDETGYLYDVKALCEAISHWYDTPIPATLQAVLPQEWRALANDGKRGKHLSKRIRMIADHWDGQYIYGYSSEQPSDESLLRVDYTSGSTAFADLPALLHPNAQLNLLAVTVQEDGTLIPELIVMEPDYLLDISALAECLQTYGDSPMNYLLNKFRPREVSHYILLGNAANQFLDDCVNEQPGHPAIYRESIQKAFRNELLAYTCCDKIDREYFNQAQNQFNAIRATIQAVFNSPTCQIEKDGALLEPSFLCESLGLQGRMDFLQGDFRNLIELKSGKAEGLGLNVRPKESHALQMALYKEVLYYNLDIPRDAVNSYLFYSQYPKLFAERSAKAQIQRAIALRNRIVANEYSMKCDGGRNLLLSVTPSQLNTRGVKGRLWEEFQSPQLERLLAPFHTDDTLLADYFFTFTAFVAREQFLSKMGDTRPGSNHGFAGTWNSDTLTKLSAGDIFINLRIKEFIGEEGIEKVVLEIPAQGEEFLPNFRRGDIVLLYEREEEEENATNRLIIRGSVDRLEPHSITISLRNKQRTAVIFNMQGKYAIEHDFMDSSYTALYKGLYTLLTTPSHRRDLLLGRRKPETIPHASLHGKYANEQINSIVLQAKQAQDYFLLVGPPGTGKTSVALRSMVEEFHSDDKTNILLLAFTNRAVDEICEMLEHIEPCPEYIRIGSELACDIRFRKRLMETVMQDCANRQQVSQRLEEIRIIVGTVASVTGHPELFQLKHFDVAIIDEASQILEPQILGILCAHQKGVCAVKKFILIGDHKQLPAVVLQNVGESRVKSPALRAIGLTDCRNSLFERLMGNQDGKEVSAMLHRQGRMHPEISGFVNRQFYNNKLDIVPVSHQQAPLEWILYDKNDDMQHLVATSRMAFIDTPLPPTEEPHKINRREASTVAALVKAIHELCLQNKIPFNAAQRIGIIVPFRNQIAMIAHELALLNIKEAADITIDTVERYQGSQRDIILFSTTVSRPYQLDILSVPAPTSDGQQIDRKLNVALTRARKQMFIIGNAPLLTNLPIYKQLIEYVK